MSQQFSAILLMEMVIARVLNRWNHIVLNFVLATNKKAYSH